MTRQLLKKIEWQDVRSGSTYLYGSLLRIEEDGQAILDNERMAPGKPLANFLSRTNYQGNRFSPILPILEAGQTYDVVANLETIPENRYYIQIDFFNRQNETIQSKIFRVGEERFVCPEDTFSYQLTVRSAGCSRLTYRNVTLYHVTQEASEEISLPSASYQKENLPEELDFIRDLIHLEQ
ncbi:accessory Sec system protein Asp3 [Streptococcus loxodontisalivarius]|uniref:Accessory secretory protein Asp3 n=1 Tax=Streptococcus loxodontisalivarius TaxID=1349415 RepID=A0ABS2PVK5_9STRE|nr:accessory Sec system protein Asp3 [Streptococcus loxodontisalivarius]MBM7643489.1 accessory secretory protein Asp3 [Streptococcus loxodontisalivarius]